MEEYDYYYEGDRLTSYRNEEGKMIYLHYDENNQAIGFHYEGEEYFYVRDAIGNINKIMDIEGKIVASYSYNAWGEVISEGGNNNLHKINQLMYKGYVYDREINLYYCKSRYYNPEWCRFINADDVDYINSEYLNGLNLFAYCYNNPVMY